MKKLLLLYILSLFALHTSHSQEWFPVGAKWHYNWRYNLPIPPYTIYYPEVVEVVKDTIVLGRNCKKLVSISAQYGAFSQDTSYVMDSLGKVYYYPPLNFNSPYYLVKNEWSILYDFTKNSGDTIFYNLKVVENNGQDTFTYYNVVDTTYYRYINGDTLKAYNSTPSIKFWPFTLYFAIHPTEVIGDYSPIMFGGHWSYNSFTINPSGFRCYEDTALGFYQSLNWQFDCDSVWSQETSIKDLLNKSVTIFPNPASEQLNITITNFPFSIFHFQLFDLQGNLQLKTELNNESHSLDISQLKSGMYIYEIESDGLFHRDKLIIE